MGYQVKGEFILNREMYISRNDEVFTGVCGGIAEFFGFKSSTLRIVFIIFTLLGYANVTVMLYISLIFLMPNKDNYQHMEWKSNIEKIKTM